MSKKNISVIISDDESSELTLLLNEKAENKKNFEIITEADMKYWINNVEDFTEADLKTDQLSEDKQIKTAWKQYSTDFLKFLKFINVLINMSDFKITESKADQ